MSVLLLLGAMLTATLGCVLLALSQSRHWHSVTGQPGGPTKPLRRTGWTVLAGTFALALLRDGVSFAMLSWPLYLGLGALITSAALTWRSEVLRPLAKLTSRAPL